MPYERLLSYFYYLHNARLQLIHQQQHIKETVDNRQQQTQQQAQLLRSLSLEQQRQQAILLQQHKQHEQALAKVSNQLTAHQQQLATLLANKQALEKLIQELQRVHVLFVQPKSPFSDSRGKLNWPASGKLVKRFGSAIDQSG